MEDCFTTTPHKKIIVQQKPDRAGDSKGPRTKYQILTESGEMLISVEEPERTMSNFFERLFFGTNRRFILNAFDTRGKLLFILNHRAGLLGKREFDVVDTAGESAIGKLIIPLVGLSSCKINTSPSDLWLRVKRKTLGSNNFLVEKDRSQISKIAKVSKGFFEDIAPDNSCFHIEFTSEDLSPTEKLMVILSTIAIDTHYYECNLRLIR